MDDRAFDYLVQADPHVQDMFMAEFQPPRRWGTLASLYVFTGIFWWVKSQRFSHLRGGRDNDYSASVTSFLKVVTLDVHCCSGVCVFFPTGRGSEEQGLLPSLFSACLNESQVPLIPVRLPPKLVWASWTAQMQYSHPISSTVFPPARGVSAHEYWVLGKLPSLNVLTRMNHGPIGSRWSTATSNDVDHLDWLRWLSRFDFRDDRRRCRCYAGRL